MTVTTVTHTASGEMTSTSTGGVSSSNNAPAAEGGFQVRSGMHGRTTHDVSQIADDDIVQIDGMEIKASMAREMGLLGAHVPDEGLNAGSAAQRTQEEKPSEGSNTGHLGYDQAVDALNAKIEAGQMDYQEATAYDTAIGQVALAGLTITEVSETIDGIADGSIDPNMIPSEQRQAADNLQKTVSEAARTSVLTEIGQEGFNRLHEIAKGDAEFNSVLVNYASMRALGKAELTWTEFLQEAESWSRGDR